MAVTAFQDLPMADRDRERVKSHLAKHYAKTDDVAPWDEGG